MSNKVYVIRLVLTVTALSSSAASARGTAEHGAQVFRECAVCHSTKPGEHLTGRAFRISGAARPGRPMAFSATRKR